MLNANEEKYVKENFGNEKNCLMFFADLSQLQEENAGHPQDVDLQSFTSDGTITGIVTNVNYNQDNSTMSLDVICEGSHRYLDLDCVYVSELLKIRNSLIKSGDTRDNANFEFIISKPFLLKVVDSSIVEFKPLDVKLYESSYSIFEKLMEE